MKTLILAGGFGVRLKEVIHDRPKVMAPINGRPFLEYVIENLRKKGVEKVVISIGYLGDYLINHFGDGREFGVKISYSAEDYPLGTAGAIKKAEESFESTFLVVNGDTYLDLDVSKLLSLHQKRKAVATIILTKRKSTLETGFVSRDKSGRITSFTEKPEKDRQGLVNTGYYIFEPEILKFIKGSKRISLEKEIFPLLAKKGFLYGAVVDGNFIDIGTPKDYEKVKKLLSKRKRRVVIARAPVRVSFAGGGTDLPSYFLRNGGSVVLSTIDKFAHVTVKMTETSYIKVILEDFQREETYLLGKVLPYDGGVFDLYKAIINRMNLTFGAEISIKGDFPTGSGLGTSSSITVALVGGILKLEGQRVTKKRVAQIAAEVEREILKIPGGWQDQYASSFGGFNFIEFLPGGKVKMTPLKQWEKITRKLEDNLMLFYISAKRTERKQQVSLEIRIKRSPKTKKSLDMLKRISVEVREALEKEEINQFGNLLHKAWLAKKASSSKVTTGLVDKMYGLAMKKGAYGGKLLGAGGGGCLLICAPSRFHKLITKSLEEEGARLLSFKFEFDGLKVKEYGN